MTDPLTELVYPMTLNEYGDIAATSNYATQVKQGILSCIATIKGERVYRPDYGLAPTLFTSQNLIAEIRTVKEALTPMAEYPDVTYNVTGWLTEGLTNIEITYTILDTTNHITLTL